MSTLALTTTSLEVVLGGAVATTELDWTVTYVQEYYTIGIVAESTNTGTTNGTTDVTMVAAPVAGARRHVRRVSVHNNDTTTATVTVKFNITTADRIWIKETLAAGDTLHWENNQGWYVT